MSYTVEVGVDPGIAASKIYRFVLVASNQLGDSDYSNELIAGIANPPPAPLTITADSLLSNATSLYVTWSQVTTSDLPVLGYILYIDDGIGGDFNVAYNGSVNLQQLSYLASGLLSGRSCRFKAVAVDINGLGTPSAEFTYISCVAPSKLDAPSLLSVGKTIFVITWDLPKSNGGCPITSYKVYSDMGSGLGISNLMTTIANNATFEYAGLLASTYTGKTLRMKVEATNVMGSVLSPSLQFVLASTPDKPTPAPYADISNTTTDQILVSFVNTNTDNGGSPVTLIELQRDDGNEGDFFTILLSAQQTQLLVKDGIERGNYYRFRYRVRNVNGWSDWSDTGYIVAFSVPEAPPAPQFIDATTTTIDIYL